MTGEKFVSKKKNYELLDEIQNYINEDDLNKPKHYNVICNGCKMDPIKGFRYKCLSCNNFNYCEKCMEENINSHPHTFNKIKEYTEYNEIISKYLKDFAYITQLKREYSELKGLFFYKTNKNEYELDILKIFQMLLIDNDNNRETYPKSFYKKLPFYYNLLLCEDNLSESEIYSFCLRAVKCIRNSLFIIVRPEEMNIRTEKFFFKTFNKLLDVHKNDISSCIIILYIDQATNAVKQLKISKRASYI